MQHQQNKSKSGSRPSLDSSRSLKHSIMSEVAIVQYSRDVA